jgi:hypothetical protein
LNLATAAFVATIWAMLLERGRANERRRLYALLPVRAASVEHWSRPAPWSTSNKTSPLLRPLPADERNRFAANWLHARVQFVDEPARAFVAAERLVEQMLNRGGVSARKLVDGVDGYVAALTERHPELVADYREARRIAAQHARGVANRDDLRHALVCYTTVCDALLRPA